MYPDLDEELIQQLESGVVEGYSPSAYFHITHPLLPSGDIDPALIRRIVLEPVA